MNIKALHSLMTKKGYYYFEGNTNSREDFLYICFSTSNGGRGDAIDLKISNEDSDIIFYKQGELPITKKNIPNNDVFSLIEIYN